MPHDDLLAHRAAVDGACGGVEGVEQLAQRHRERAPGAGALVGAGADDDEVLGGRAHGVEQELAVLAAHVALADERIAGQHVVAVLDADAGEHAVVEAEQAHDAVRDRAHRDHRRDGEGAGAEVGAARTGPQPFDQQGAHVGEREGHGRGLRAGGQRDLGQLRPRVRRLPRLGRGGGGERLDRGGERGDPPLQRAHPGQLREHPGEPVDELRQPADALDVAGVDLVERQRGVQPVLLAGVVARHRHPEQHPIEPGRPGVLREPLQPVRPPVRGVEAPAHTGGEDELAQPLEVVLVEPEAAADGCGAQRGRGPATR